MTKKKILGISLAILVLLLLVLLKVFRETGSPSHSAAATTITALPVDAVVVRDTSVMAVVETIGTLEPNESVEIVPELSEKLVKIHLKEGSYVKQGELLFKLDDSEILAQLNTLRVQEELAAANEKREKALLTKGGVSQETFDMAANQLKVIRANMATLEVELAKTSIRAPFDGKAGIRSVSEGAWVTPSLPLVMLQDIRTLKVLFDIPERYAGEVSNGQTVQVSLDRFPDPFIAVVNATDPAVDIRTRTLRVQAILHNPEVKLLPGSSVRVTLNLQTTGNALFVPSEALIPSPRGYSVFVVRKGHAETVEVTTALRTSSMVQVLSGLVSGDTVITTNLLRLRNGMAVSIRQQP